MSHEPAIVVDRLSHTYSPRLALDGVSFSVAPGEVFAFLGPNGGGKTTLFRVLSTLVPLQQGSVSILGHDLRSQRQQVRERIGVVFQSPSLDKKLTVLENIRHQAALYGLFGAECRRRADELIEQLGLRDRVHERTETLSGGLRRRVELAKGMIHRPQLLLLDEPSTGLDPGARSDLWAYLRMLRGQLGVTVVLTTHLLEEADRADRLAILNRGTLVALDTPDALRSSVGGNTITIQASEPARLAELISQQFGIATTLVEGTLRLEQAHGPEWIARLVEAFPGQIQAITLGKPTLEDVFIQRTGHRLAGTDSGN